MKKWIFLTAAVMFALGLALGGAFIALAQGNTPPGPGQGNWFGGMMHGWGGNGAYTGTVPMGRGMMRGWGSNGAYTGTAPIGPGMMRGWGGNGTYTGTAPFGPGMMRGWGYGGGYTGAVPFGPGEMHDLMMDDGGVHEQVWTAIAQKLDMTYDQLQTALQTKSLAQIAQEKGVSMDQLQSAATTAWTAAINQLVAQGKLTREQADWMIQRMSGAGMPCLGGTPFGPAGQAPQGFRGRGPGMMGRTW